MTIAESEEEKKEKQRLSFVKIRAKKRKIAALMASLRKKDLDNREQTSQHPD